ncbi:MAG TPA: pilus assembly protein TadG-related protein [Roseiflexaceae bacterium]|nr:pilus assembly protein TadG-related protein [Roseiflexaceae bacterium]
MKASLVQHKSHGQSIPLIAAMLVFLFGMVALAVDVGQTYAEQRNIVRGTNAAALAGMNNYLASNSTNGTVRRAIEQSLAANGVRVTPMGETPEPGERTLKVQYLDASGAVIVPCGDDVGSSCASERTAGVKYIRVDVNGVVATYFARLFGADELPVSSYAFSKLGICTSGIYPIGVRYTVGGQPALNTTGFVQHDGFYTDETYNDPPLKYKKIYLYDIGTNPTGGFALLRWHNTKQQSGNRDHLATMLAGDGNLSDGFTEVKPWPEITEGPAEPAGYPREPNIFSDGDWVYGNDFRTHGQPPFTGPVLAQLEYHKKNRTLMTLPLFRYDNGRPTDPAYYVETLGAFLLLDYGQDAGGPFLTLAYVREGGRCASLETNPPPAPTLTLAGQVSYIPRFRQQNNTNGPIQFLVVLDTTGSMSWNFAGEGKINGNTVSCVSGEVQCTSGPLTAWPTEQERRIYIAKQVLNDFVDELGRQSANRPYDVMRIVSFSGDFGDYVNNQGITGNNAEAVASLTAVFPSGWSNNPSELKTAIRDAGMVNNNPYLTDGATPTAVGLARAAQVFDGAPKTAPDGKRYRRVVIVVTDGVANVLRNGMLNNYGGCSAETVACQAGYIPGTNPPVAAPLQAMVDEARTLYSSHVEPTDGAIYVVALGDIERTGLSAVASDPELVYPASDGGRLSEIFNDIQDDAVYGQCIAGKGTQTNTMSSDTSASSAFPQLPYPKVGEVYLTHNETGQQFTAAITASGPDGKLGYVVENLPPGAYTLKAWIGHKPAEDETARVYDLFVNTTPSSQQVSVSVTSRAASLSGVVEYPFTLDLNGSVCATEGTPTP